MNLKKIKIIIYFPLVLFFIISFYYPLPAGAAGPGAYCENSSDTRCNSGLVCRESGQSTIGGTQPYACLRKSNLNTSMPNLKIPDLKLQIDIPGLILTKGKAIVCTEVNGKKTCKFPWIAEYIAGIYKYAIGIVGILSAVVLMIGGILWIVAGGNATTIGEAKAWIGASLTGLVIALCSYLILYQVNPALVGSAFKPLELGVVQDIKPEEIVFTGGGGEMGTSVIPTNPAARDKYDNLLKNAGYDCTLLKAIMFAESSGRPEATSPMGAIGLMQLMPSTAGIDKNSLYDPQTNINAGGKYVAQLSTMACNGSSDNSICKTSNIEYIIAAYNGGPKANKISATCPGKTFWQCEQNVGYAQTRKYVSTVMANFQSLKNNGGTCQ